MNQKALKSLQAMGTMNLLKSVVLTTAQSGELLPEESLPFVEACQKVLNCETPLQVVLLSAFVEMFDDLFIQTRDLADHFGVRRIEVLSVESELGFFIDRGIISRSKGMDECVGYRLEPHVIPALMENRLPETKGDAHTNAGGLADELRHSSPEDDKHSTVIRHDEIDEKPLFFSCRVSDEYNRLRRLLLPEQMRQILDNLESHRMRKCFTCLFYGEPGTGKTESVRQLARESGRDILLVEIPSIRSKWVGGSEKNIKAVFDRYRSLAKEKENIPILLFNEADAILGRRSERTANSVDKMENAMQNIILQEMESLEGIMMATTNLTSTLDHAFERRFLYKIRFGQPSPEVRKSIWRAHLPDLSEEEYEILARSYSFSGGEIENIARRYVIESVLTSSSPDIYALCDGERVVEKVKVGFSV